MIIQRQSGRCRLARRKRSARVSLERLEDRRLLAVLSLESATVKPDGRILELLFSGPDTDGVGVPDEAPALAGGTRLTTNLGTVLEPLGAVVTKHDGELVWTESFLVSDPKQVITFDTASVNVSAPDHLIRDDRGNWTASF